MQMRMSRHGRGEIMSRHKKDSVNNGMGQKLAHEISMKDNHYKNVGEFE